MLLLLLNLALIWGLVVLFFTVRSDQLVTLITFSEELEADLTAVYSRLERNARQRLDTDKDLAALKRQKRLLLWKLRALIVFLACIYAPFALARFLLGLFQKK
jgi:hypothetical protein